MTDPDFNALGRYTHLCELAKKQAQERQQFLRRANTVLSRAVDDGSMLPVGCVARGVNFNAIAGLLGEAQQAHAELVETLRQIEELAPIIDRRPLTLA